MASRINVAVSGLTAAGKTTHARILAGQLGYKYVSAIEVILDLLGVEGTPERIWFSKRGLLAEARKSDSFDREVDARLLALAGSEDGIVFDSWAVGWIYRGPMVRLWFESDKPSRTRKCFVSQGDSPNLDLQGCAQLLDEKDASARDAFLNTAGFDLYRDRDRYDAILDNSTLIPEPTEACSRSGIEVFAPVVLGVTKYLIDVASGPNGKGERPSLELAKSPYVRRIGRD